MHKQLVVIGGGAAGVFCAVNAARLNPGLKVLLLEKTSKLLSKVKVSGGGRCNVTHACYDIAEMVKKYPRGGHFVKRTFYQFFTSDTIEWFETRGVKLKSEHDGRMFPASDSSQTIIDCLLHEVDKYGVQIRMNAVVQQIECTGDKFNIVTTDQRPVACDLVCIACGGYPKLPMFDWLGKLGHTVQPPVPSLFTFNMPNNDVTALMGITIDEAVVKIAGTRLEERGPVLITHWGMSGPAILRLSAWGARELAEMNYQFSVIINWLPGSNEQVLREQMQQLRFELAAQKVINRNPFHLPQRFWEYLLNASGIAQSIRWADLPAKDQHRLIRNLCSNEYRVNGKTTFKEEFVTAGGIKLNEVDANTMMSKKVRGLFFAGEIIDVDGITGGFNFQHAWSSAYVAAKAISQS